jgi:predicted lysophospholipase L1 biosynthesis ABC-type transport system permease subunit
MADTVTSRTPTVLVQVRQHLDDVNAVTDQLHDAIACIAADRGETR